MEKDDIKIPLFHVDTIDNNKKFVAGESITPSFEDGDWAGRGLYFWDNAGNAEYWLKEKLRKNKSEKYSTVKAFLTVNEDKILDLTEPNKVKDFEKSVSTMIQSGLIDSGLGVKHKGAIINAYYNVLSKFGGEFSVVKIIGYYPKIQKYEYFKEDAYAKDSSPFVTIKAKVIYAVRNQNLLVERRIMEADDYEF